MSLRNRICRLERGSGDFDPETLLRAMLAWLQRGSLPSWPELRETCLEAWQHVLRFAGDRLPDAPADLTLAQLTELHGFVGRYVYGIVADPDPPPDLPAGWESFARTVEQASQDNLPPPIPDDDPRWQYA